MWCRRIGWRVRRQAELRARVHAVLTPNKSRWCARGWRLRIRQFAHFGLLRWEVWFVHKWHRTRPAIECSSMYTSVLDRSTLRRFLYFRFGLAAVLTAIFHVTSILKFLYFAYGSLDILIMCKCLDAYRKRTTIIDVISCVFTCILYLQSCCIGNIWPHSQRGNFFVMTHLQSHVHLWFSRTMYY